MELFDEGEVIPASEMKRPQSALDREMFEDANKRFNQAEGGRTGFRIGESANQYGTFKTDSKIGTPVKTDTLTKSEANKIKC